jgi:transposase
MKYYTSTTEFNCGIDLHSRQMYVCVMDRAGNKLVHTNIQGNDFAYFLKRIEPYRHSLSIVCECTFNWYWLADACQREGLTFVLAHALYLKAIHGGKNKNDRIDSEKLAHLLRSNLIPPSYVYPGTKRPVRALLRQRLYYVWRRAELLARIQCHQLAEGHTPVKQSRPNRDPWEERLLAQYENPLHKSALEIDLHMIRAYDEMLLRLERELLAATRQLASRDFALLNTVPGIGRSLGLTILYEIDTIARFPTVKDFTSYCRLVKGSVASAGKLKGHRGAKLGNPYLRWAFGEAAVIGKRDHPLLRAYAQQLEAAHGKFRGNAILAHKLARAVYFMLKNGTGFDVEKLVATSTGGARKAAFTPLRAG